MRENPMQSFLLDRTTWDLVVDDNGNLAVCSEPYSTLQDVATAIRTWAGECWYDTTLGLPYATSIFAGPEPLAIMRAQAEQAALNVPGVTAAQCLIIGPRQDRSIGGAIIVTLSNGETQNVNF